MQITELTLCTNKLSEIKKFYLEVLELKIISESQKEISFQAGSSILKFIEDKALANPFYHFAFNIPANKLEEALSWMQDKVNLLPVGESLIADFKNWNAKSIYFLDSVGNIVEFISRFDLKTETNERFNSSQILSVSEIGIIADDVSAYAKIIRDKYSINDFSKSQNDETFSAMGDDNGLFIIVNEARNWYPTKTPSGKFPFEVKFTNNKGKDFCISN